MVVQIVGRESNTEHFFGTACVVLRVGFREWLYHIHTWVLADATEYASNLERAFKGSVQTKSPCWVPSLHPSRTSQLAGAQEHLALPC